MTFLIKADGVFYNYDNGWNELNLTEPLTEGSFNDFGFDISLVTNWDDLPDQFEVLCFTGGVEESLEISTDQFSPVDTLNKSNFEVLRFVEENNDEKLELTTNGHKPIFLLSSPFVSSATDSEDELLLKLGINVFNSIEYLVSLDNVNFAGFDGQWRAGYGMTLQELQSIPEDKWKEFYNRIYQKDFYIRATLKNQLANSTPILKSLTVQYAPNTSPTYEIFINPSEVSRETATVHVQYEDMEGDFVEYRVFIQKPGESFQQVYPQEGFIQENIAGEIAYSFNYTLLKTGLNQVRVELKDSRGSISNATASITMVNEDPFIVFTNTTWNVTGVLDDPDGDKVDIRVVINGQVHQDYLGFTQSPRNFYFEWDSPDLILNQENVIRLEAKDERGGEFGVSFNVIGTYRGLMFKDEEGMYYTTDKGELLKLLNLGVVIAGQKTEPQKIYLENTSGYGVEDIEIYSRVEEFPPNASVMISKSKEPFFGQDKIIYLENVPHGEEVEFYVSVETTAGRGKLNAPFTIEASPKI